MVWADYSSLRRLTWILLENALKYTPSPGRVNLTVKDGDRSVIVTVKDNGIGISAADLPHIFERFYRASDARGRPGAGLGLAIVGSVAQANEGTVEVRTGPAGSAFTLAFPPLENAGD